MAIRADLESVAGPGTAHRAGTDGWVCPVLNPGDAGEPFSDGNSPAGSAWNLPHQAETKEVEQSAQGCGRQFRLARAKIGEQSPVDADLIGQLVHWPPR